MRILATLIATTLLGASNAYAGGIGVVATGGAHTELVHYYSNADANGNPYANFRDYDQYQLPMTLAHGGAGLELMLGDRDDKITGVLRGYYNIDAPQQDPSEVASEVAPAQVVSEHRDKANHIGIAKIGVNWGFLGDPGGFQFGVVSLVGAGFLTNDHQEFLTADIGPSVQYRMSRSTAVFADVTYTLRWRKRASHGAAAYAGFRYLFD
jgi:hypothetical protein